MNYAPPKQVEISFRPSYSELANSEVYQQYRVAENDLINSREGSEYIRRRVAEVELEGKLRNLTGRFPSCAEQPSQMAISVASELGKGFIRFGLIPDAVTPSPEGGVAICFMRNQKYADVECLNTGEILGVRYSSQEDPIAWVIAPESVATDATAQSLSAYLSV